MNADEREARRLAAIVVAGFFVGLAFLIYIIATDL